VNRKNDVSGFESKSVVTSKLSMHNINFQKPQQIYIQNWILALKSIVLLQPAKKFTKFPTAVFWKQT